MAIGLLSHCLNFTEIYRRSLQGKKGELLPLDDHLITEIIRAGTESKAGSSSAVVRRDLSNHLSNLNKFFKILKTRAVTDADLTNCKLRADHIAFDGFLDYAANPRMLAQLDNEIDTKVTPDEPDDFLKKLFGLDVAKSDQVEQQPCDAYEFFEEEERESEERIDRSAHLDSHLTINEVLIENDQFSNEDLSTDFNVTMCSLSELNVSKEI